MGTPAIERLLKEELPVPALPAIWEACAITESAVMPMPATVVIKFVREAGEETWSGQPIVAALKVSAVRIEGRLPAVMGGSRASFTPESVPVEPSTVGKPK